MQKKTERTPVYWDGILDLINDENKAYRALVQKLESREYKSVKIELKNTTGKYPVFGMYQDDTIRVLSTQIEVDKKKYLILVELMLDHDYKDNPFMQDKVRDAYMDRHYGSFAAYIRREEKRRVEKENAQGKDEQRTILYKSVMLHHNKVISLSIQQAAQLNKPNRTLLIEGGPGSGKTVLAHALLEAQLRRFTGSATPETLVYITQSAALTRKTEEHWNQQPHYNPYGKRVIFRTYDAIVKEKLGLGDDNIVGKERFLNWMEKTHLTRDENKKNPLIRSLIDLHGKKKLSSMLYREFRVLSGYDKGQYASKDHAAKLPSLFSDVQLRSWIADAYEKYAKLLEAEHKCDTALIPLESLKGISFDYIVLDEAQDLSFGQLAVVHRWRGTKKLAVLKDENQNIHGDQSNTDYLRSLVQSDDCQRVLLTGSFRCPLQVTHLANQVLALKLILTRGVKAKLQQHQIELSKDQEAEAQQGNAVQWVDRLDDIQNKDTLIKTSNESPDVLVVTSVRYQETARKIFHSGIVITIDEIEQVKGLQFSKVILYQVLDDDIFIKANMEEDIPRGNEVLKAAIPQHRAKEGQERPDYAPPFDKLFVALTRCAGEEDGSGQVVMIQKKEHKQEHLIHFLKTRTFGAAEVAKPASVVVDVSQLKQNTEQNWLDQAKAALENNNSAFALYVFTSKLNKTEAQFKAWQKSFELEKAPLPVLENKEIISPPAEPVANNATAETIKHQVLTTKEAVKKAVDEKNVIILRRLFCKGYPTSDAEVGHKELLSYLFHHEDSMNFLYRALKNPAFYREFLTNPAIPNMLCQLNESTGNYVFYHFVADHRDSLAVFEKLTANQNFVNRLSSEKTLAEVLLTQSRPKNQSQSPVSAFVFMSSYDDGLQSLSRMLSNPILRQTLIEHPDFIHQLSFPVITNKRASPKPILASLLLKSDELPIFYPLFANEDFYQRAFACDSMIQTLCSVYSNNVVVHCSALYWLIVNDSDEAKQFILKLSNDMQVLTRLCANDDFYTALLARMLPQDTETDQYEEEQTSILYWIHRYSRFRDLRDNLYKIPGFLQKLIAHKEYINALLARRVLAAAEHYNDSILALTVTTDNELMRATLDHPQVSHRLFSDQRFYDTMCARMTKESGVYKNFNCLYAMVTIKKNVDLVDRLFNNPLFIEKLRSTTEFIPTLLTTLNVNHLKGYPPSLLFEMVRLPKNHKYLINLLKNPIFREELINHDDFVDALTYCIRDKNNVFNQITTLYMLCLIQEEDFYWVDLFLDWCTEEAFYNKLATNKKFIQALVLISQSEACINKLCPLLVLLDHPGGINLLARLYRHPVFHANLFSTHIPTELLEKFTTAVIAHEKTSKPAPDHGQPEKEVLPKIAENTHSIFAKNLSPKKIAEDSSEMMQPSS